MHEGKEVTCRCGGRVFTEPSLNARCPECGRRLFWKCQCGALVERVVNRCPQCGAVRERTNAVTRPRLRLRKIVGAGLTGAFVFALLGYCSHKALSRLSPEKVGDLTSSLPHQSDNIVVLTLKGILLLFTDAVQAIGRAVSENPLLVLFSFIGFVVAAALTARRQQLSWRRLKRHLRRKWEQMTSRWLP